MNTYTSRYPELTFYVNGASRSFRAGQYQTEDKDEIAVLDQLRDVQAVATKTEDTAGPTETPKAPARKAPPKK